MAGLLAVRRNLQPQIVTFQQRGDEVWYSPDNFTWYFGWKLGTMGTPELQTNAQDLIDLETNYNGDPATIAPATQTELINGLCISLDYYIESCLTAYEQAQQQAAIGASLTNSLGFIAGSVAAILGIVFTGGASLVAYLAANAGTLATAIGAISLGIGLGTLSQSWPDNITDQDAIGDVKCYLYDQLKNTLPPTETQFRTAFNNALANFTTAPQNDIAQILNEYANDTKLYLAYLQYLQDVSKLAPHDPFACLCDICKYYLSGEYITSGAQSIDRIAHGTYYDSSSGLTDVAERRLKLFVPTPAGYIPDTVEMITDITNRFSNIAGMYTKIQAGTGQTYSVETANGEITHNWIVPTTTAGQGITVDILYCHWTGTSNNATAQAATCVIPYLRICYEAI